MKHLAITTCSAEQWKKYGRAMAATFCRHWPDDVPLWFYTEEFDPGGELPVSRFIDLYDAAPWLLEFKARHRDQRYNGGPGGRDYRRDAVRFSHKVAAIGAAADDAECDVLIWMDADIVTHAQVTLEWLEGLFPTPATVAWLDRERTYPECGFLMFRMPDARPVINEVVAMYRAGALFQLPEWHDSYVIQHVVNKSGVAVQSLSGPEGRKHIGHPFANSPVAACMDHLKGEVRKLNGRSLRQDIKVARPEPYWQWR